ncbi:MAG TPA: SDR family NAD(P)-dependent oxidoreductase [Lacunisphaera sp.]|nr:SDR family NAD(P)-dependent oxidoreductase [Lacunisphaera sp.]
MSSGAFSSRYRTAFVTGASTGLGLAFTQMLLAEGTEVWGTARDPGRLPARAGFHPIRLDLVDGDRTEASFREAEREAGGFDLVINNAGFGAFGSFACTDFAVWEEQFQVMLVNTARLAHVSLRSMLARRRGALVNISSLASEFALPYQPAYNAVKAGLSALNESLMYEVKGTGVIVIDFRPGDYRTDFERSVRRPEQPGLDPHNAGRQGRAWNAFEKMMRGGPDPVHAARTLRKALARGRSGTVRTGRLFQAWLAPLFSRFAPLWLKRRVQEIYFEL